MNFSKLYPINVFQVAYFISEIPPQKRFVMVTKMFDLKSYDFWKSFFLLQIVFFRCWQIFWAGMLNMLKYFNT